MRAEDTPEPAEGHRPLPSVKIPLLREERRATRVKQAAVAVAAGLTLAGAVATALLLRNGSTDERPAERPEGKPDADAPAEPAPAAAAAPTAPAAADAGTTASGDDASPTPVTPGAVTRKVTRFGKVSSFRQAVGNAGLDRDATAELEAALDGVLDFRRCRPEHQMVFEMDADGRLLLFEYHPGPTEYVQATRGAEGELRAEKVQVPVKRVPLAKGGRIVTSLGDALETAGLGRSLVGVFVTVFDGKVSFSTDTRQGDVFRILVDEEHIGGKFQQYATPKALEYVGQRAGKLEAFWFETKDGKGDYYDETGRAIQGGWIRTPLHYDHISSKFDLHRMHPILHRIVPHNGVDFAASTGTPVWAAADGEVTWAARKGANGNLVIIRHADGYETLYCHLSRFARGIKKGVHVDQRQLIGYVGSTGRSTGPHLHFSLKRRGRYLDPLEELNGPGKKLPPAYMARFRREKSKLEAELRKIHVGPAVVGGGSDEGSGSVDEPMD